MLAFLSLEKEAPCIWWYFPSFVCNFLPLSQHHQEKLYQDLKIDPHFSFISHSWQFLETHMAYSMCLHTLYDHCDLLSSLLLALLNPSFHLLESSSILMGIVLSTAVNLLLFIFHYGKIKDLSPLYTFGSEAASVPICKITK